MKTSMLRIRTFRHVVLSLILAVMAGAAFAQEGDVKVVVAEGVSAAIDPDQARDRAREDALRRAVEQAAGVLVDAATMTENYELLADKIFTNASGYVRTFRVLEEKKDPDGMYRIRLEAEVVMGNLKSDLMGLELLRQRLGYPKVMVVGEETVDNVTQNSRMVATEIENFLLSKEFDLVARDFQEMNKARNAALASVGQGSLEEVVRLGNQYGAEVVVTYQANADYNGANNTYGVGFEAYMAKMSIRIIKVDTAAIMASMEATELGSNPGRQSAAQRALTMVGKKAAPELFERIVQVWSKDLEGGTQLELVVVGIDFKTASAIKRDLIELQGVKSVGNPEIVGNVVTFRLKGQVQGFDLAERVETNFQLTIEEVSGNRVKARK